MVETTCDIKTPANYTYTYDYDTTQSTPNLLQHLRHNYDRIRTRYINDHICHYTQLPCIHRLSSGYILIRPTTLPYQKTNINILLLLFLLSLQSIPPKPE